ncbi:hypothetical protein [uncultured Demequina sp.]|uniref:hypothetical protein n=1 Tax=uncultured Demequina sp. TaxID=693499 RepID=UPI0025F8F7E4|nr:hypothetical protein [uncultured Demequina sp.]
MSVAVVGVALALQSADRTVAHYAAQSALAPGTVLEPDDLRVVHVRVGDGGYVTADAPPWGMVVTRAIGSGELVPVAALGEPGSWDGRVLGVVAHAPVDPEIEAGSTVDLWLTVEDGAGSAVIAEDLVVAAVAREDGAFSVSGGETVYLSIPSEDVASVLDAVGSGGSVTVVGRGTA